MTQVETPEKKQNFDWIYVQDDPTAYKTEILDLRSYICDNNTRGEWDRIIHPKVNSLLNKRGDGDKKVRIADVGMCFGNTTLALVHGMTTDQIRDNWKDAESCKTIKVDRRLPAVVTGIDISEQSLAYCKRVGIADEIIPANLNTEAGLAKAGPALKNADILISTASLVYLNIESVEYLIGQFASGDGEAYAIVNFLNPFELEKTDQMKAILLKHLDFVGSTASQHRTMSDKEKANYPDYGDWALLEIWTLKRRTTSAVSVPTLTAAEDIKAPAVAPARVLAPKSPSYKELTLANMPAVTDALVVAASRLSELDSLSGPKCLIRLGNLPIICHILSQLRHAGVERAVVLCGYKGEKIKEVVERDLDQECQDALQIDYVMTNEDWRQGSAYSILKAQNSFGKNDRFLVCMADHIFDPAAIASMCSVQFTNRTEQAFCLLETETTGMVGLSSTCVKMKLTDGSLKVNYIGRELDAKDASGVDAGLFTCDCSLFEKLAELAKKRAYFSLADAMDMYVSDNALTAVKTEGKMWFAVETKEALAFAVADGLKQIGTISEDENWMGDGAFDQDGNRIAITLSGKGKEIRAGGNSWAEFTVERWRSAVYINLSYFGDLYTDTIDFITDIAKHIKLRGERATLIEVGCGTGEFIRPIADHFRLSIGMDFNKNFIEFCNENIPKGKEEKMAYYEGDACELVQLMRDKAPKHIWNDTKIVACVGNTIGIIPEEMKPRVYQQMAELAGPAGVVVMVYWNSKCFGDACQNFYFANPQLCGPFSGDSIDFSTTTLKTPAPWNYRSHWTGIDEARAVLRKYGLEEIMVEERGKGVLAAARVNTKTD